jgi:activator of HSP90 ATPase
MPTELRMNIKYRVPVRIIYDTLTNIDELIKFTQSPTKFDKSSGGIFSLYDGFITGTNEKLEENKKIVQKWKFNNWKDFADLTLTFKEKDGNECLIQLLLQNIPERDSFNQTVDLPNLEQGFKSQIFEKISKWLGYPMNNDQDDSDEDI